MIPTSCLFDQSIIAALLKHDPLMQGYRAFFASLNWSIVEQWQAQPRACGTPCHPISAYLKVFLSDHTYCYRTQRFRCPLLFLEKTRATRLSTSNS
jgi:hypothetical protein